MSLTWHAVVQLVVLLNSGWQFFVALAKNTLLCVIIVINLIFVFSLWCMDWVREPLWFNMRAKHFMYFCKNNSKNALPLYHHHPPPGSLCYRPFYLLAGSDFNGSFLLFFFFFFFFFSFIIVILNYCKVDYKVFIIRNNKLIYLSRMKSCLLGWSFHHYSLAQRPISHRIHMFLATLSIICKFGILGIGCVSIWCVSGRGFLFQARATYRSL